MMAAILVTLEDCRSTKVVLGAAQGLVSHSVGLALSAIDGLRVVASGASLPETLTEARRTGATVVLLDAELLGSNGLLNLSEFHIAQPDVGFVVMDDHVTEEWLGEAVVAGVRGYLPRSAPLAQLASVVRAVGRGELAIPRSLERGLVLALARRRKQHEDALLTLLRLTRQEQKVLRLLVDGATNETIAAALVISPQTARTHVQNILAKLGVRSRLEAVAFVIRNQVLQDLLAVEQ
jgi:two-component system, NarL family, nitrate/nitrite response regulator NarL